MMTWMRAGLLAGLLSLSVVAVVTAAESGAVPKSSAAGETTSAAEATPGSHQDPSASPTGHTETGAASTHEAGLPVAGHGVAEHGAAERDAAERDAAEHGAVDHGEPNLMDEAIHTAENVSFIDLILKSMGYQKPHGEEPDTNSPLLKTLMLFQLPMISVLVIGILALLFGAAASRREMIPGPLQNFAEMLVGAISDFVEGILGLHGRRFVPYVGSLFLYIWVSNLIGILPFFKAPTSSINTTVALAICTFFYVQYIALRGQGLGGYIFHLAGEPRDTVGWMMVPLMLPLHIIGEFAKPMSLCLRLFGNIFGEETLVAVFVGMGVAALAFTHLPLGLPFQTPFYFLALLTSTIQALVFSLLTTIYISLVLPHHPDEHHGGEQPHGAGKGAVAHHGAH